MKKVKGTVNSNFVARWWFPLLVVIIVVLGLPLVIIPKIEQISSVHRDLNGLEQDLKKAEKKISQLKAVDEAQISGLSASFKQALPTQKPYYEVLLLLQQLGAKTGVVLGDFELNPGSLASESAKTDKVKTKDGYVTLDTELRLTGSTDQISAFVVGLHESLPLLKVQSISIGKSSSEDQTDLRTVSLALQVLYKTDPQAGSVQAVGVEPLVPLSGTVSEVSQSLSQYYNPELEAQLVPEPINGSPRTDIFNF